MVVNKLSVRAGIDAICISDNKYKTDLTTVGFIMPASPQAAAEVALLSNVLTCSCEEYRTMKELNHRLDGLYDTELSADVAVFGDLYILLFTISALNGRYSLDGTDIRGGSLEMLSSVIMRPLFDNGIFQRAVVRSEKKQLISEIESQKSRRRGYAVSRCAELMYKNGLYTPRLGRANDVEKVTAEIITERYKEIISSSPVQIVTVSGDNDGSAEQFVQDFSALLPDGERLPYSRTAAPLPAYEAETVCEEEPAGQGVLCIGFDTHSRLSDGDYHIFSLYNEILAGAPTSKLFMNVRERLSLCYYCSAGHDPMRGVMIINAGIENEKFELARDEIFRQVDDMRNGCFSDDELNCAKRSLKSIYSAKSDSPSSVGSWYFNRALCDMIITTEENARRVASVTREEIISAAERVSPRMIYFSKGTGVQ